MQCIDLTDKFLFAEVFDMGKDLSEMTLKELWELFPVFLAAYLQMDGRSTKGI